MLSAGGIIGKAALFVKRVKMAVSTPPPPEKYRRRMSVLHRQGERVSAHYRPHLFMKSAA